MSCIWIFLYEPVDPLQSEAPIKGAINQSSAYGQTFLYPRFNVLKFTIFLWPTMAIIIIGPLKRYATIVDGPYFFIYLLYFSKERKKKEVQVQRVNI